MQTVQIQTPEGVRNFPFYMDSAAVRAARDTGEIAVGDEIVYREHLVEVMENDQMLALERIGGMPNGFPPFPGTGGAGGADWMFTMNGVPVTPEEWEKNMRGE